MVMNIIWWLFGDGFICEVECCINGFGKLWVMFCLIVDSCFLVGVYFDLVVMMFVLLDFFGVVV